MIANPAVLMSRINVRRAVQGTVLVLALACTPVASAQFGGRASFGEAFQPDVLQRDVPLIVSTLKLEDAQRDILEILLADYSASFNTGVEGLKERMKVAAETAKAAGNSQGTDRLLSEVMKEWEKWRTEKRKLYDKFIVDLQSQLGDQQRELWPKFDRALRRERQLPEGELSGESVDLWAVIHRMQLTPLELEAVRIPLDEYEIELDTAIQARVSRIEQLEVDLKQAMLDMNYDKGADIQDSIATLRLQVRAANDSGIEKITKALGDRGEQFRMDALRSGYPDVFRRHPVLVLIDQALAMDTLTAEQRKGIEELRSEMEVVSNDVNQKFYELLRVEEPKGPRRKLEEQKRRREQGGNAVHSTPQGSNQNNPIIKARVEREQAGEPYRQRLMAILTPDQAPELPDAGKLGGEGGSKQRDTRFTPSEAARQIGGSRSGSSSQTPGGREPATRRDPRNPSGTGGETPPATR